jgi:hypothetical protein
MISRVGCLQTGVFSLPRIWPLELHWPRAPASACPSVLGQVEGPNRAQGRTLGHAEAGVLSARKAPSWPPLVLARTEGVIFFLLRLVLLEETNNTQAPGQDTRRAPHSGRERSTRGTGTETGVGGGVGSGVLVWQRGRGRCVTSEEVRLDRPASETS